jgi:hypothetical protein
LPFLKRRFETTVAVENFSAPEDPPSGPLRDTRGD